MKLQLIRPGSSGASVAKALSNRPFERAGRTTVRPTAGASAGRSTPIR